MLSDPERRKKFDIHGITEEGLPRRKREGRAFNMHESFPDLFGGNIKFHYHSRDITLFHKMSISYR